MEPNSLIFFTLITKLQSHSARAIWLSGKIPQQPFPTSEPLDCIACKILTHYKSSINSPLLSSEMRFQTPPFLSKKRENCRKIIKVPLHVHETFGTIHTIKYHCSKCCSRGGRNKPKQRGTPERGKFSGFRYLIGKSFFFYS